MRDIEIFLAGRIPQNDVVPETPETTRTMMSSASNVVASLNATQPTTAAFAARLSMLELNRMLQDFAGEIPALTADDLLLAAAARALDALPVFVSGTRNIALEIPDLSRRGNPNNISGGTSDDNSDSVRVGQIVIEVAVRRNLLALHELRCRLMVKGVDQASTAALLSLKVLETNEIRPVALPLLPGRTLRLVLTFDATRALASADTANVPQATEADCLLIYDTKHIDIDSACDFLQTFKRCLELPIRLLL